METLVFSQCHIRHDVQGRLMRTSLQLMERLNPGIDFLLIDNASPLDPLQYVPFAIRSHAELPDGGCWPDLPCRGNLVVRPSKRVLMRFRSAIGHFNHDKLRQPPPKDGPGRAITTALSLAMAWGYRRAVYLEVDCLAFRPIEWGFSHMGESRVGFQPRLPVGYLDNQVWHFGDLEWLRASRALERYCWPERKGDFTGEPTGEQIWESIFQDDLSVLPWRGTRAGMSGLTAENMREQYPEGIDYITHTDRAGYCMALEMNGHNDLAPALWGGG